MKWYIKYRNLYKIKNKYWKGNTFHIHSKENLIFQNLRYGETSPLIEYDQCYSFPGEGKVFRLGRLTSDGLNYIRHVDAIAIGIFITFMTILYSCIF